MRLSLFDFFNGKERPKIVPNVMYSQSTHSTVTSDTLSKDLAILLPNTSNNTGILHSVFKVCHFNSV